ncbi:MAG TPA: hypothetical protein VE993_21710 [Stellaceae bacterium]|nr:hypothetical protein [Stellaceae bacterium]
MDAGHHRPERRQLNMVPRVRASRGPRTGSGIKSRLIRRRQPPGAMRAERGIALDHPVGVLSQRAEGAGMALSSPRAPLGPVALLAPARQQRGIGRRLRRRAELGFKFFNPPCQHRNLRRLLRDDLGLRQDQRDQFRFRKLRQCLAIHQSVESRRRAHVNPPRADHTPAPGDPLAAGGGEQLPARHVNPTSWR